MSALFLKLIYYGAGTVVHLLLLKFSYVVYLECNIWRVSLRHTNKNASIPFFLFAKLFLCQFGFVFVIRCLIWECIHSFDWFGFGQPSKSAVN